MSDSDSASSIPLAPPPWKCKCTAYVLAFYNSASAGVPTDIAYASLEANAPSFSSEKEAGKYKGGLCMVQIIRFSDTPVGAYDELAILPGHFETAPAGHKKSKDLRITGIWVSQKVTLMNGRRNWNIPKHLARFEFTPSPDDPGTTKVEVFSSEPSSSRPFFAASIKPISYTPAFPFSSSWFDYIGIPTSILQPPLPTGEPADLEVGTDSWMRSKPSLRTSKARAVWIDMKQPLGGERVEGEGEGEGESLLKKSEKNWWPGMGRWHLGILCDDAELALGMPEILD